MSHHLLGSQKDDVFGVIEDANFDPAEFEWADGPSALKPPFPAPALVHTRSNASFTFDYENGHIAAFEPGHEKPRDVLGAGSWDTQLNLVRRWLANLKRELNTPNLWDELAKERELTAATEPSDDGDNSLFTPEEQQQIASQLRELLALLIRTETLEGERLRVIQARLDYLQEPLPVWAGGIGSTSFTAPFSRGR